MVKGVTDLEEKKERRRRRGGEFIVRTLLLLFCNCRIYNSIHPQSSNIIIPPPIIAIML